MVVVGGGNSKENCFFKLLFSLLASICFLFFYFRFIIFDTLGDEVCPFIEYIGSFVYFVLFFTTFYYFYYSIDKDLNNKKLSGFVLITGGVCGVLLGTSIEIYNLISIIILFFYSVIFLINKEKLKKQIGILIICFAVGLILFYNLPVYLIGGGFGDHGCLQYHSLYNGIFTIKDRLMPFIKVFTEQILLNKYFLCLSILIILSYIPNLKILNNKKNIITIHVLSIFLFFFSLIFIADLSENGNEYWITYHKFYSVFLLLTFFYLFYEIILYITSLKIIDKISVFKSIILIVIIYFCVIDFIHYPYKNQLIKLKNHNIEIKKGFYVKESIYLHYAKKNQVAIIPSVCMDDFLEEHWANIMNIKPADIYADSFLPFYNYLQFIYGREIPGYRFINKEQAYEMYYSSGGEKINLDKIDFNKLLQSYKSLK